VVKKVNLETSCGAERNGKSIKVVLLPDASSCQVSNSKGNGDESRNPPPSGVELVCLSISNGISDWMSKGKLYKLNVMANAGNGLRSVYEPLYFGNGVTFYSYAAAREYVGGPSGGHSAFFYVLVFMVLAVLVYIIGGITLNYCRGHRGSEVVPNHQFWHNVGSSISSAYTSVRARVFRRSQYEDFLEFQEDVEMKPHMPNSENVNINSTSLKH